MLIINKISSLFVSVEPLYEVCLYRDTAIIDLVAKLVHLTAQQEEIDFVALRLLELCLLALLVLLLLVLLESVTVYTVEACLLMSELIGCLVQLIDMVAKILRSRQLEEVSVESWHVRLNMIEKVSLHEVAAVNSDRDLLKELRDCQVLRSDALLNQSELVPCSCSSWILARS